ncbi:ATP-binding protein [Cupriavidus sp. KB_39]|uniref:ATP-binding protein n=1 Tax=Cupriavidus sp. KB_39 TaxID=3233036 RepID=UPI003F91E00E
MKVVFVGGVHGVGKTTACEQVSRAYGCIHISASDLIRRERADAIAANEKQVNDIDGNQELLVRGFRRFRDSYDGRCILLDGHFALRDGIGDIQRLPLKVFRALAPDHLICFEDEPAAIADRMRQRDLSKVEVDLVSSLQHQELLHAGDVALDLEIPLTVLHAFDVSGLQQLVSSPSNL